MKSPLVVEVWGKQSGQAKSNTAGKSTRQLMSQDNNARGRAKQSVIATEDDDRYKLLCELNTYKRRAQRMEKKLVCRVFQSF